MQNNIKKVIITGATSMIGLALINYLVDKDIEVLAVIRKDSNRKKSIPQNKNVKILEADLDNIQNIKPLESNYDVMYHFAWDGTSGASRNDIENQEKNIHYTLNALKMANNFGCKVFIGAGSQAEYGRVEGTISETTLANPETAYGCAKLSACYMSRVLANQLNITHIWTRIFSVYGPNDGKNTMVMSSIKSMLNGESPEYTKGEQLWDYLYCDDIAKALYLIAIKGKNESIYCIGSGKQKMLKEYIEMIRDEINPQLKLKLGAVQYSKNQVMNLAVDISKLKEDTGFSAEIEFKEGIKRTIDWYKKENLNEKN